MKPRFAVTSWSETSSLTRAQGSLALSFKRRGPATVLDHLYQQGCAKARFPKAEHGAFTTAVTLNTSGGLTGGDRLDTTVDWGAGTQATVAAQAAERGYRSIEGTAMLRTRLSVEAGAQAEWLPQETILFDGAALDRDLQVEVAADGWFLGIESVVFGRTARGESVQRGTFRDAWRVRRDGRLIYADVTALAGDMQARLDRQAMGQGARAASTIVHVAPDAADRLEAVRAALDGPGLWGASAWDGLLAIRLAAPTGALLRGLVMRALTPLRQGRPLPRVWQI
jgi:urease accessory protein